MLRKTRRGAQPAFRVRTISSEVLPQQRLAARQDRHQGPQLPADLEELCGVARLSATASPRWQWWQRALQLWVSSKDAHQGRRRT